MKLRNNSTARRNSEQSTSEMSRSEEVNDTDATDQTSTLEIAYRRSRSLTGSPIASLTNASSRRSCSGSESAAAETGFSKPPLGANVVSPHRYRLRSASKTPPRSPRLSSTRSTPDLYSYLRRRSIESDCLLSIHDQMTLAAPTTGNTSPIKTQLTTMPHQMVDSPDHPAASNTSRNFPIVEEESISPTFKSLSSVCVSSSSPSVSVSFPSVPPILAWSTSGVRKFSKGDRRCSSRSSSESLSDAPPIADAEVILENASSDFDKSFDVTFSHGAVTSDDVESEVSLTVNDLLDQVCQLEAEVVFGQTFITIKCDDGTLWRGDNIEMSVWCR